MGISFECILNQLDYDQNLFTVYNTFNNYTNFRFNYIIRASYSQLSDELDFDFKYPVFDPNQENLLTFFDNYDNVDVLQKEFNNTTKVISEKKNDIQALVVCEEGLRKNIKHLEDIISIKESFNRDAANNTHIRRVAKEKVLKEYDKLNKKYHKILAEKSHKLSKVGSSRSSNDYSERYNEKISRYEEKLKKMAETIQIADDCREKLLQNHIALKTSKERLNFFYEQLNNVLKDKQEIALVLIEKEKRTDELKKKISSLKAIKGIEKSRVHTSSNMIKDNSLKKEFLELQNMRTEVLSSRPKGMFNPKYQKEKNFTEEEIRNYLKNDLAIDSIDFLIELKNSEACNNRDYLLNNEQMNSNESEIFLKCLSTLNKDDMKQLLIYYFIKIVDLKECGCENDDIIATLDDVTDKQRRQVISMNNNYQEFHLSIEKKFMSLKRTYQQKINMLFQLMQEENSAITVFKMRQEIASLKKKLYELEKSHTIKSKEVSVVPQPPHKSLDQIEASKSGSETMSSAKVTYHKNKLKIQKNKSK